jgi:hypothetical protein
VVGLKKRGKYRYGDSQADIREELSRYGTLNGYPPEHFADAVCACGGRTFRLQLDDTAGAAVRTCPRCAAVVPMGDSAEYLEEAELDDAVCPCGEDLLELTVGVSLYAESDDVRWLYLGARCPACTLVAVYGDWKNEFEDYRVLLSKV